MGLTVMSLKETILSLITPKAGRIWVFTSVYYILMLPMYFVILLDNSISVKINSFLALFKRLLSELGSDLNKKQLTASIKLLTYVI